METIYLCIVIFLFVLAVFDLIVGVSNDAVNFLQSSVGAKAASFKTVLFIAGIGVFIGAALSNGMMDIGTARYLSATALLFCRNHVYPACRDANGRSLTGCLQHNGYAYFHYRVYGIRATRRNIRPGAHQSKQ